jgi:hypothetical protein
VGIMAQQAEHDEIGIEAVQTVSGVGVAAMSAFCLDEVTGRRAAH